MKYRTASILAAALLSLAVGYQASAQVTLTEGTNYAVDAAPDGRLAIDLLGTLWVLPPNGGVAAAVSSIAVPVHRPQWAPDGNAVIFEALVDGQQQIWRYELTSDLASNIAGSEYSNQDPSWHPSGERIVFASERRQSGLDLWELDLATGLNWRITHRAGDEIEPAWSADGRDLVYVHHDADGWSIVLRRLGEAEHILLSSGSRLSAPRWRPDGSLITFLRDGDASNSIDMIILSDPLLVRSLITAEDFFQAPVSWLDRDQFVYTANGAIRKRNFNSWTSSNLPFRATIGNTATSVATARVQRELPPPSSLPGRLVLRTARLFDGIGGGYRSNIDIVMDGGKITALEAVRDRPGEAIVDLGNVTALPGFIDSLSALPANSSSALGALLLSLGVTTIVAEHENTAALDAIWSGKDTPGPRVLAAGELASADTDGPLPWLLTLSGDLATGIHYHDAVAAWQARGVPVLATNWQAALGSGARMLLGADSLPASPGGKRYADSSIGGDAVAITLLSGLADSHTPGIQNLQRVRQAPLLPAGRGLRRLGTDPELAANANSVVLGSRSNGLPPGLATQAEFLALAAAGLNGEQLLRAAGVNAAAALGLGLQLGRLAPGSIADVVVVDGDPLQRPGDLVKLVGVVRNGRFYSAIGLLERAQMDAGVE